MKLLSFLALPVCLGLVSCQQSDPGISASQINEMSVRLEPKRSQTTDRDEVFIATGNQIHITGKGWGYLETKESYDNFRLTLEYKWGERTWGNREKKARDAGVFLHCHDRYGDWPRGVEVQLIEGGSGNLNFLHGKEDIIVTANCYLEKVNQGQWFANGLPKPLRGNVVKLFCEYRSPQWRDVKGIRGTGDVENPVGEWNQLEVLSDNGVIEVLLNGKKVNRVEKSPFVSGSISLQSEEAEWFVRNWKIEPLPKS